MRSEEIPGTKYMNVTAEAVTDIELPQQNELTLFVQCVNEAEECSFHYETIGREMEVSLPAMETSTYPAENTLDVLKVSMSPAYYKTEGDVEVTLRFTSAPEASVDAASVPEEVELTLDDFVVKNGRVESDITKVSTGVFTFTVKPAAKSSFAVIVKAQDLTKRGLAMRRGAINVCVFDDVAPQLLNTQYKDGLVEDAEEKTIVLALSEPCTAAKASDVVVRVAPREGAPNTFEVVVRGTGEARVDFTDAAGNVFAFSTPVAYAPESAVVVVRQPVENATVPLNGRVEFRFNHAVRVNPGAARLVELQGESQATAVQSEEGRYLVVEGNRVLVFLDAEQVEEGAVTLKLVQGAFVSEAGKLSEEVTVRLWVAGKRCNTNYVVQGMRGQTCKCFSVEDRCQCNCGETLFSREY